MSGYGFIHYYSKQEMWLRFIMFVGRCVAWLGILGFLLDYYISMNIPPRGSVVLLVGFCIWTVLGVLFVIYLVLRGKHSQVLHEEISQSQLKCSLLEDLEAVLDSYAYNVVVSQKQNPGDTPYAKFRFKQIFDAAKYLGILPLKASYKPYYDRAQTRLDNEAKDN